jgi:hypothetical protein
MIDESAPTLVIHKNQIQPTMSKTKQEIYNDYQVYSSNQQYKDPPTH